MGRRHCRTFTHTSSHYYSLSLKLTKSMPSCATSANVKIQRKMFYIKKEYIYIKFSNTEFSIWNLIDLLLILFDLIVSLTFTLKNTGKEKSELKHKPHQRNWR